MPEPRDRIVRPDPIELLFVTRRWGAGIPQDTGPQRGFTASPSRPDGRNLFVSSSRTTDGRNLFASTRRRGPTANKVQRGRRGGSAQRGRGRATNNSPLPSWYPRRPLRDITEIVLAIERRSHHIEPEPAQLHTPLPAPLEHNSNLQTPNPEKAVKPCMPSSSHQSMVLQNFDSKNAEGSDFITPQKKLLDSIEQVEKVVIEEFRKHECSRSARKLERQKKVHTLMSMR
ncbi:protein POLYCHOME-like [Telopea speciosissima]|uniref:protein POLYCHOME-like n=1 Tax=Telopea speciosissima TaxID=54955 RepID=UPI001CC37713|nr:protein POLYCHOME-like [Telopea speciosissima]